MQVPVKHEFSDTFDRERLNGKTLRKVEFNNFVTLVCKIQSHNFFEFLLYFHLFYTYDKAKYQPRVNGSPNTAFIRENKLKPTSHPVKFVDDHVPVYNQNKARQINMPSLISTEDLLKLSNKKAIDLGMGDTCYDNFVPFTMDEFERHLYLYYWNGLNPSPRIDTKFNPISAGPVQGNEFLHNYFGRNAPRQHK